jgi:hypothetical protein
MSLRNGLIFHYFGVHGQLALYRLLIVSQLELKGVQTLPLNC